MGITQTLVIRVNEVQAGDVIDKDYVTPDKFRNGTFTVKSVEQSGDFVTLRGTFKSTVESEKAIPNIKFTYHIDAFESVERAVD